MRLVSGGFRSRSCSFARADVRGRLAVEYPARRIAKRSARRVVGVPFSAIDLLSSPERERENFPRSKQRSANLLVPSCPPLHSIPPGLPRPDEGRRAPLRDQGLQPRVHRRLERARHAPSRGGADALAAAPKRFALTGCLFGGRFGLAGVTACGRGVRIVGAGEEGEEDEWDPREQLE